MKAQKREQDTFGKLFDLTYCMADVDVEFANPANTQILVTTFGFRGKIYANIAKVIDWLDEHCLSTDYETSWTFDDCTVSLRYCEE